MRVTSVISIFIYLILSLPDLQAQDSIRTSNSEQKIDSLNFLLESEMPVKDTVAWVITDTVIENQITFKADTFKPNPKKAVIYSAIFPGLGQIYNRKYWKLPIVYGGFLGFAYAISWNGRYYGDYSDAYNAIMSDDPYSTQSSAIWLPFTGKELSEISQSELTQYQTAFKNRRDYYRRYRDLSIIGTVALYALCMVDAYVDAHLFDFDISPDLSFKIEPAIFNTSSSAFPKAVGVQCNITF